MHTKLPVDADQLAAIVAPLGQLAGFDRLDGGLFASTFAVDLMPVSGPPRRVVVKVVSDNTDHLLRYERGVLGTEALVYAMADDIPGVPMPSLLRYDTSRASVAGTAVVAEYLDGQLWEHSTLTEADHVTVRRSLGAVMARLHTAIGEHFGYPAPESDLSARTWPEAFTRMVNAVLDDAVRFDVDLPADRIRAALSRHETELATVTVPRLVHTDLWAGNVFLAADHTVCGVIDPERAVWGDPVLDFVGCDQLGVGAVDAELLAGYAAARAELGSAAPPPIDPGQDRARIELYRMYFAMLMTVEMVPRGASGEGADRHRATLWSNLHTVLDRLGV